MKLFGNFLEEAMDWHRSANCSVARALAEQYHVMRNRSQNFRETLKHPALADISGFILFLISTLGPKVFQPVTSDIQEETSA